MHKSEFEILNLRPTESSPPAAEAPLYVHEVHILINGVHPDLQAFEKSCNEAARELCSDPTAVWSVRLVDLYKCPQSKRISHVIQIAYCSIKSAISRDLADTFREGVENRLCGIVCFV